MFTGHNHNSAFAKIVMELDGLKVRTTIDEVDRKRKNLKAKYYRRLKAGTLGSWELGDTCTSIFGKEKGGANDGVAINMADPDQVAKLAAHYTKGQVCSA